MTKRLIPRGKRWKGWSTLALWLRCRFLISLIEPGEYILDELSSVLRAVPVLVGILPSTVQRLSVAVILSLLRRRLEGPPSLLHLRTFKGILDAWELKASRLNPRSTTESSEGDFARSFR